MSKKKQDLAALIMSTASKLETPDDMTQEEQDLFNDLAAICRHALAEDIVNLSKRIENHFHRSLTVRESKEHSEKQRASRNGAQIYYPPREVIINGQGN